LANYKKREEIENNLKNKRENGRLKIIENLHWKKRTKTKRQISYTFFIFLLAVRQKEEKYFRRELLGVGYMHYN